MEQNIEQFKSLIRDVPDFPKSGVVFKDITTLIKNNDAFNRVIDIISKRFENKKIDKVVGIEARGFIFAGAIADRLNAGVIPVRKEGKLPAEVYKIEYDLEYGKDVLEIHKDALSPGDRILVFDDLLATGGTIQATVNLVQKVNVKIIEIDFLIELTFLQGRRKLKELPIFSLVKY